MQDCMERCSRYWGDGEGCFGVVWRIKDKYCWLRTSKTSAAGMVADSTLHSALVVQGDMSPLDTKCGMDDLSIHSVDSNPGIGYTVHCDKIISGYDDCFSGYASCEVSPYIGFYHATSLLQCMEYCVKEHPLCRGVSYNPGLEMGFANCWPKTGFTQGALLDSTTVHTLTITSLDRIDSSCPTEKTYDAKGDKAFAVQCGKVNAGTNITSVHMSNVTSCMDLCATSNNGCTGITFDSGLTSGYDNCYLQNTTQIISDQASGFFAEITGSSTPKPTASSVSGGDIKDETEEKEASKAWIAGPVIGGILGLALIAGAFIFLRRRKAKSGIAGAEKGEVNPYEQPHHQQGYGQAGYAPPVQQHESYGQRSEIGGSNVQEMGTGEYGSAKYAKKGAHAHSEPQELA
jgi:hypothetical protein